MNQQATPNQIEKMAAYVQAQLDHIEVFAYGNEPEVQVDFHIPCERDGALVASTLAAMIPCLSRQHTASAFQAGEYVQLSLHKEPSTELAEAFFHEALLRLSSDKSLADKVAKQIARNQKEQAEQAAKRTARLQQMKAKMQQAQLGA